MHIKESLKKIRRERREKLQRESGGKREKTTKTEKVSPLIRQQRRWPEIPKSKIFYKIEKKIEMRERERERQRTSCVPSFKGESELTALE
jgi:hypothetical protein